MIQEQLVQRLEALRSGLRKACLVDGFARLVIAAVAGMLAAIVLDYIFFRPFSGMSIAFRFVLLGCFLGTVFYLVWRRLLAPLAVPLSVDDMALSVEREFPQLNDSLISTIQLTRMMANETAVSQAMVDEVSRAAHAEASALDFSKVVKFERMKNLLYGSGGALLFVLLLAATPVVNVYLSTGIVRLFTPWMDTRYPVLTFISINEKDQLAARGENVNLNAVCSGLLPGKAYIRFDFSEDGKGPFGKDGLVVVFCEGEGDGVGGCDFEGFEASGGGVDEPEPADACAGVEGEARGSVAFGGVGGDDFAAEVGGEGAEALGEEFGEVAG